MNITLPAEFEGRISSEDAALHLALGLFIDDKITLGQAAAIAGVSQPSLLRELGKRGITVHYGLSELTEDIATVNGLMKSVNAG